MWRKIHENIQIRMERVYKYKVYQQTQVTLSWAISTRVNDLVQVGAHVITFATTTTNYAHSFNNSACLWELYIVLYFLPCYFMENKALFLSWSAHTKYFICVYWHTLHTFHCGYNESWWFSADKQFVNFTKISWAKHLAPGVIK